jgi:hypothetical protein
MLTLPCGVEVLGLLEVLLQLLSIMASSKAASIENVVFMAFSIPSLLLKAVREFVVSGMRQS